MSNALIAIPICISLFGIIIMLGAINQSIRALANRKD
jgi:hypothetical protein